jgi:hypothetical protein
MTISVDSEWDHVFVVGLSNNKDRHCPLHPNGCGASVSVNDVLQVRSIVVNINGKNEEAIGAYSLDTPVFSKEENEETCTRQKRTKASKRRRISDPVQLPRLQAGCLVGFLPKSHLRLKELYKNKHIQVLELWDQSKSIAEVTESRQNQGCALARVLE